MATKSRRPGSAGSRRSVGGKRPSAKRPAAATKRSVSAKRRVSEAPAAGPRAAAPEGREERRRRFPESLRLRNLSPSLTVSDLAKSLEFYVDGLGFTVKERWEREGKLRGVTIQAGTAEIGLSQDDWAKGRDRVKGVGVSFYAETGQSLDLIAALAREHHIEPEGPKVASWGDRILEFRDPDGYKLTFYWPKR